MGGSKTGAITAIKDRITGSIYSGIEVCDSLCFKDNTQLIPALHSEHSRLCTKQTAEAGTLQTKMAVSIRL